MELISLPQVAPACFVHMPAHVLDDSVDAMQLLLVSWVLLQRAPLMGI